MNIENIFTLKEVETILNKNTKSVKLLFNTNKLEYSIDRGSIRVSEQQLDNFFRLIGLAPLKIQMAAK